MELLLILWSGALTIWSGGLFFWSLGLHRNASRLRVEQYRWLARAQRLNQENLWNN